MLFKDIRSSDGWQKSWKIFLEKSDIFFNTLFNIEEKYFYHVSDSVYKMICKYAEIKEIIPQPAANFLNFIRSISKPGKSYAADSAYRIVISPEEAEEIYFNISCNYNDDSQGLSKIYLYECALAEKVIKQFIIKKCLSEKTSDKTKPPPISDWKLLSSSDDEFYSALPTVKAGNKEYPICVIPPRLKGFSIRNDLLGSSLNGVLFCSFKKYPSDEILVRFDNYIEKDRVFELLKNTDVVKGVQNVTKLSFDDVYKFDKREEFLQEAAEAVMGLEKQPDWMIELLKKLFIFPGKMLDKTVNTLRKIPGILEPEFKGALTPERAMAMARESARTDENIDSYYVPTASLTEEIFLNPESPNEYVAEAVKRSLKQEWQCIYLFVDTKANIIDGVHGPLEISRDDEDIENIGSVNVSDHVECVWFFIGPVQTLNKIKTEYTKKKTLAITKQEKLYWIIYGPTE